jgi:LPS sulfotransferase NodH
MLAHRLFTSTQHSSVADKLSRHFWTLDAPALLARAKAQTGLHDFGDPPVEPALTALVQSLDQEADLHPLGRFMMWHHLADLLETRLRLVDAWTSQADRLGTGHIARPLFITGMPRSGSTFLHELLAADPGNRVPRAWEIMSPVPPAKELDGKSDPRIWRAAAQLWWFRRLAPAADALHPIRARSPQECETIHSYTLLSQEFTATCWVPHYEAHLQTADFVPTYRWQKRFLQHLQGREQDRRWVLKSPDHAHTLNALLTVFPDAVIVQTHRNPTEVLTSTLQLVELLHGVFAHADGREQRAEREIRVLAEAMEQMLHFRDTHPELAKRFIDVNYSELVADPITTARRIYHHWDMPLTAAATASMRQLASQRSRYPRSPILTKLTGQKQEPGAEMWRFNRYCTRFGV